MISKFFIDRPVFATVLSIVIVLAGLAALRALPVEQYPQIVPPEVVVMAQYPGASAQTISETVAAPIEQQVNGVENMIYMRSASADAGYMRLSVYFDIGTDPDQATINVNNRVKAVESKLPEIVRQTGVTVQKRSSNILAMVALTSPDGRHDRLFMSNYALLYLIDELKRVPGIGDASLFGQADYSMRIWLQPDQLAQYELTPSDVAAALREQNIQPAVGAMGAEPNRGVDFTYTVTAEGRFARPEQFEEIILRANPDGSRLRLRDVARVELGAQRYTFSSTLNGKPTTPIALYLQPGANALETTAAAIKRVEQLSARFPEGLTYVVPYNTTKFVEVSVKEVIKTLIEALVLVVVVVYLFLQNFRATLIPLLAVPVSLIGTFAGMYMLGFSINLLTLFGMILAIGIVVDDAIVVLENVERIMREEGLAPRQAAFKAMEEVTGPVIAIVLVLCAVFIPVGFLGGLAGVMYKQFAITIAVSVIISGIVALTLTPALCALMLKPGHHEPAAPFRWFNRAFDAVTRAYLASTRFVLKRTALALLLMVAMVAITAHLFNRVPGSLVPNEDQGILLAVAQLPAAASLSRTSTAMDQLTAKLLDDPVVENVVGLHGFDILAGGLKTFSGGAFVTLTDWGQRKGPGQDADSVSKAIAAMTGSIPDTRLISFVPPPIQGMSTTGGFEGYVQSLTGAPPQEMEAKAQEVVAAANLRPELRAVRTTMQTGIPQYRLQVDREKARALGVPVNTIFETMQATFGSLYVNDFILYSRTFQVNLQSEASFREKPEDLGKVFVRSTTGQMIPLANLVEVERTAGPDLIERFNVFPSAKIMGDPAEGYSSGQAIAAMEAAAAEVLGNDYQFSWISSAYQEKAAGSTGAIAFVFGLLMVFLILAAQYERWSLPLAVVTAVPFAMFGAILAIWLRGLNVDLYFQIGLLVLVGLASKNAILIIEFAVLARERGASIAEAAMEAARLRFRPIVMTSLAFILGVVPLAISSGAGANSRHSIGTGVIGGMLGATVLAIIFVPLFYRLIEQAGERMTPKRVTGERVAGERIAGEHSGRPGARAEPGGEPH